MPLARAPEAPRAARVGRSTHAEGLTARDSHGSRSIGPTAFTGVVLASFGGPLALAALIVPEVVEPAGSSAGLAVLFGAVLFAAPLAIWLSYAREVNEAGGLYSFVRAAAGPRLALAQSGVWAVSYVLYLVYTTVQIVYEILPTVFPVGSRLQGALALAIPVAMAGLMIAGRGPALIALGVIGAGQLVLAGILGGVALGGLSLPAHSFGLAAGTGAVARAGGQGSLLFICGSLPLFLGGEVGGAGGPSQTMRRGLVGGYLAVVLVVLLVVASLAAAPGLLRAQMPGFSLAGRFAGAGLADTIAVGVMVSVGGVMLAEYLALTRLLHALSGRSTRLFAWAIGVVLVVVAPFTLIDPDSFYDALLKPSIVALWVSQMIVFAVFPLFARRRGQGQARAWALAGVSCAMAGYGIVTVFQQSVS